MSLTAFRFGAIEADGTHVIVHVTVSVAGMLEHPIAVRLSEDVAHRLVARFNAAIAKLNRTRLGK